MHCFVVQKMLFLTYAEMNKYKTLLIKIERKLYYYQDNFWFKKGFPGSKTISEHKCVKYVHLQYADSTLTVC